MIKRRFSFSGLILCALAAQTAPGLAHPHVWVTMHTDVQLGQNGEAVGLRHKWTFDQFYTSFAVEGMDTNGDGVYSEEELRPLGQTNIEALKEFEYFTYAFVGKTRLALKEPTSDYRLEYKDDLLTLYFTIPLEKPVPKDELKDFSFSIYDPGIYVSLTFAKEEPVRLAAANGGTPPRCAPHVGDRAVGQEQTLSQLGEDIDPASNIGAQFAERVTFICTR
ncbi:DUF1007 family protein [Rhodomicrobium sp. Az07]|uniref:DUF1007 family protein n=1 Tax=Rhodomicrobium sp. Az07 TaxID=2839034 RepID=UPI001BE556F6|nr:DUF1007 family protein [Rhodomicrobium sp. Az07]MBT3069527.1 DUF1007 family protein [Rhodomicrobium sp. Az07]